MEEAGGALRGIGEKFSPVLHTGTGNFQCRSPFPLVVVVSSRN